MTERTAHRLLAGLVLVATLVRAPNVAAHLAVHDEPEPRWFTGTAVAALVVALGPVAVAFVRGRPPHRAVRVLVGTGLVLVVVRTLVASDDGAAAHQPWLATFVPVLVAAAGMSVGGAGGVALVLVLATGYAGLLTLPAWGALTPLDAAAEAGYLSAVGLVVLTAAAAIGAIATRVSVAEADTLAARRAAQEAAVRATESVRWDALVHDDVLSALSTAAVAVDPDVARRAADDAARALERITNDDAAGGDTVSPVAEWIAAAVHAVDPDVPVRIAVAARRQRIPPACAESLVAAVVEAVRNSVRHAGPDAGTLVDGRYDLAGLLITVRDQGTGFAADDIPEDRLGVRLAARRVHAAGGRLEQDSTPGEGTRVTIRWPA
ncbi:sensor histidine kinase [Quadrisphaera sp. GCM10027208]|uniref:sensor histidine kinase n=1 Tax=Quadrisphaera sp. GCM10027208 TaxID=3273423 RepID=UPI003606145E